VTFAELVDRLAAGGCRLRPEGETLVVADPGGVLDDALRAAIRTHKRDLLLLAAVCETFGATLAGARVRPLRPPVPPPTWPPPARLRRGGPAGDGRPVGRVAAWRLDRLVDDQDARDDQDAHGRPGRRSDAEGADVSEAPDAYCVRCHTPIAWWSDVLTHPCGAQAVRLNPRKSCRDCGDSLRAHPLDGGDARTTGERAKDAARDAWVDRLCADLHRAGGWQGRA
jgi:hypothetical protein